jgi:hypothetical protein
MKKSIILLVSVILSFGLQAYSQQDTVLFKGQLSGWMQYAHDQVLPVRPGVRYIPDLCVRFVSEKDENQLFEVECSANIMWSGMLNPFDSISTEAVIKPYRITARYAGAQYELRLGLQKISFGSASMLRPLMWFDRLDPRDPLQFTDGVNALLFRYCFLNNTNIWLWGLYGNKTPGVFDAGTTAKHIPEAGGRLQWPVHKGEMEASFHFREVDTAGFSPGSSGFNRIPEMRIGVDGKWDIGPGMWFEGSWTHKYRDVGILSNQLLMNLGADYTFGVYKGLTVGAEYLLASMDSIPFNMANPAHLTGISVTMPLSLSDQCSGILFSELKSNSQYAYLSYRHQFRKVSLYGMVFLSSSGKNLPVLAGTGGSLLPGSGVQIMFVYHH